MRELVERELVDGRLAGRRPAYGRRTAVARRPHGTGLEYGLIAAALAVAIVTVVAGLGARYGGAPDTTPPAIAGAVQHAID
ncbi:hypothetical protein [Ancylobacter mangrovi]|uniref:Flp family type IVb pilin n=1 Tax=Ancylobacter mangrovi TaxID=2972472 RepID=A0A9X2T5G2_9HYPH|nr:hypothetical protein [Ancylobacter mangrovi]MCS0495399.1 hypothetical protein [Ancylobacter mangrovi]MCS0503045.1 hypothetical protein [Ancylobacter mangrovi]